MQPGHFSQYFSDYRALLPYSLLGIAAGLLSAGAVLCFEQAINGLGYLWILVDKDKRSLHDRLSGTCLMVKKRVKQ